MTLASEIAAQAAKFEAEWHSPNTRRVYAIAWKQFAEWCYANDRADDDLASIADYLTERAESLSTSSLSQHLAAIKFVIKGRGIKIEWDNPRFSAVWKGVRHAKGTREAPSPHQDMRDRDILRILRMIPDTPAGRRDKAKVARIARHWKRRLAACIG